MNGPGELLTEAGQHLTRVEALVQRAGEELGEPFTDALDTFARDVAHLRRRLRNATTTATAGGDGER